MKEPAHILIVDDDDRIRDLTKRFLTLKGFRVSAAADAAAARRLMENMTFDLAILDVMMPGIDGWTVCRQLRERSVVPILMLTALNEEVDRVLGLELGADDYLTKPFSRRELLARIKAMLRRIALDRTTLEQTVITVGALELNLTSFQAYKAGQPLPLRHKEFELLAL